MQVLYTVDQGTPAFEAERTAVDIVCLGDSFTGWNNFGPTETWPYHTYPQFLQEMSQPLGLRIANGGIAGEISDNGPQQVRDYLALFPNARYFVIGIGTDDLGKWPNTKATSKRIIGNLGQMVQAVRDHGKKAVLFNVPNVNEAMLSILDKRRPEDAMFPSHFVEELYGKRRYHNARLKEFCCEKGIPLADICSRLRDEHFADELHPNNEGAKIIAEEVFRVLSAVHKVA